MATRSTISIKNDDGSVEQIYCHWDGYLEGVGKTLALHYKDVEKVRELIGLGDVSTLGQEIGRKHNFDHRPEGVTTFYGRDRGDRGTSATRFENWSTFMRKGDAQEYDYVYDDGEWKLLDRGSLTGYTVDETAA